LTPAADTGFGVHVENLIGVLKEAKPRMLEFGVLEPGTFEESVMVLGAWQQRPDAAIWFAMAWAEGVRPVSFNSVTG
jgi:hypothetical protein